MICPWCYVGKRRLERALDELGLRSTTSVQWLPFELNPDLPEEGIALDEGDRYAGIVLLFLLGLAIRNRFRIK